ncbi:vacuolar cation/proton exchanger 4 [Arabidopsis lyrata subsp. lyrata]|uniref:vacuolar cation/proton exchanger 4 n=1 Tax=Arabidopsis lyrata subsp. lyrata TaxID=81972 RepID=UPI000A29C57B|nr:vacuolar cation/proton exchanger 4 [Arabidopsis lyrata subsp. lyrata]|eukprot:XP_020877920.1 vacuolar cation/proton exchanger 4 [Arabidopsis lyrata subsp. lyrata]
MSSIITESSPNLSLLENGGGGSDKPTAEMSRRVRRTVSTSSLIRQRSDLKLIARVRWEFLRRILTNLQEVVLGTKLFILFPAVPLAVVAHRYDCPRAWVFALSLLGLTPLAERISFLTEQIAFHTGPTVGGLMNATCGNATEMIIAILAVGQRKMRIVKLSLLGSILSNLLFVLGTSLFLGGISNLRKHQSFDSRQGDMNCMLLYLALLCQTLPMIMRFTMEAEEYDGSAVVMLSRASSFVMLIAYLAFLIFHLFSSHLSPPPPLTQREEEEEDVYNDDVSDKEEEGAVIGMWSAIFWLIIMTLLVALLSEYIVSTIQDAADSWGLSVGFIGIILLPIVGNAAEHAGAVIFAFRNKLDITLGIALGSATQIALFVVPVTVLVAWIMGIDMDLNFNLLETTCLALSIIVTSLILHDGTSNYMKGLVLLLCYVVIAACFFVSNSPSTETDTAKANHTITKR